MSFLRRSAGRSKGFTLIELLLVIAIIAILAAIVIIAINPARQLGQANDAQRRSNVNTILNAVSQYAVDNKGVMPSTITTTSTVICSTGFSSTSSAPCVDLAVLTNSQLYLTAMPADPLSPNSTSTYYFINKSSSTNPRVTVTAPFAEQAGGSITITR